MKKRTRIGLAILSSVLMALSMPGMVISLPVWFSFALLLIGLDSLKPRKGFFIGYIFGYFYYSVAFWWLLPAFVREIPKTFNAFSPFVGFLVYIIAGLFVGLYYGLFGLIFAWFSKRFNKHPILFISATLSLLLFTEYLRSLPPLKFIGFRFTDALFDMTGILQLARIGGTELLLVLIGLVNIFVFMLWRKMGFSKKWIITSFLIVFSIYAIDQTVTRFIPSVYSEKAETVQMAGIQTM